MLAQIEKPCPCSLGSHEIRLHNRIYTPHQLQPTQHLCIGQMVYLIGIILIREL